MKSVFAKVGLVGLLLIVAVVAVGSASPASAAPDSHFKIQGNFGPQTYPLPNPGCDIRPPRCHYLYCVYYLDCHHHWKLRGCFHTRCQAAAAERSLQHRGYRTYIKVKRIGGGGHGGGHGFPGH